MIHLATVIQVNTDGSLAVELQRSAPQYSVRVGTVPPSLTVAAGQRVAIAEITDAPGEYALLQAF